MQYIYFTNFRAIRIGRSDQGLCPAQVNVLRGVLRKYGHTHPNGCVNRGWSMCECSMARPTPIHRVNRSIDEEPTWYDMYNTRIER